MHCSYFSLAVGHQFHFIYLFILKSLFCEFLTSYILRNQSSDRHVHNMGTNHGHYCVCTEMCSERDSPLEPFVLPAPGQPELARLICGAHLCWPGSRSVHGSIHSCVIGRPRFARRGHLNYCLRCLYPVTQAAKRERELARARSQRLKQAARSLPGEPVSRGFTGRGALEGYPSHYTSLVCRCPSKLHHCLTINSTAQTVPSQNLTCFFRFSLVISDFK